MPVPGILSKFKTHMRAHERTGLGPAPYLVLWVCQELQTCLPRILTSVNPPSTLLVSSGWSLYVLAAPIRPFSLCLLSTKLSSSFLASPLGIFYVLSHLSLTCCIHINVHICSQHTSVCLHLFILHISELPFQKAFPHIKSPVSNPVCSILFTVIMELFMSAASLVSLQTMCSLRARAVSALLPQPWN